MLSQSKKYLNSTGVSRDCEIIVSTYQMFSTFSNNKIHSSKPPIQEPSEPDIMQDESESLETQYDSSASQGEEDSIKNSRRGIAWDDHIEFFSSLDIKWENFRQSVIRRFKYMMKVVKNIIVKGQNTISSRQNSSTQLKKSLKEFEKRYLVTESSANTSREIFESMKAWLDHPDINDSDFDANFLNEKSCNDAYVNWFFGKSPIWELYQLHHQMAIRGDIYFQKISQLQNRAFNQEQKRQIIFFISSIYKTNTN